MQETGERHFVLAYSELRRRGNHWETGLQRKLRYQWLPRRNTWFLALAWHCDNIQNPALEFQLGNAENYLQRFIDGGKIDKNADLFRRKELSAQNMERVAADFRNALSETGILRNGLDKMAVQVLDALSRGTYAIWPDSHIVLLTGLATAFTHAAFPGGDIAETWFLRHGTDAYQTLAQVTRICFQEKTEGRPQYWETLMRAILSWMRIFGNLNIAIEYDN